MSDRALDRAIADELVDAFVRLARGDFTVRLARNNTRDTNDTLAYFVNLIAEEIDRIIADRDRRHRELEERVSALSEQFLALAGGNFEARAARSGRGDPMDVLAFLFNNTAAELSEAFGEVDRQKKLLEAMLESMIDGVILLDTSGFIQRANGAMARLIGRYAGALQGAPVASILAPREDAFAASFTDLSRIDPFRDRETLFRTSRDDLIPLTVTGSPFHDATGALSGIVLLARDDRQLRLAQAKLQMTDRLAAMGTVAASVAHEINNPLAFVIANIDFVAEEIEENGEDGLDRDRVAEILKALQASKGGAERVRQIVRDLKTFSRLDRETHTRVELSKIIDSSVSMIKNEVRHHARIVKEYGPTPVVDANEARLGQVFLNLVQNAAQAIPAGKAEQNIIRIVTGTAPSGEAFAEIHDTGEGIANEDLRRIFDPFYTTKPVGVGTGLGLPICQDVVKALGGRIEVESRVGQGTVFRVVLPAAPTDERPSLEAPARAAPRAPGVRRRRVLVIDDEPEVGDSIRRILGREHDVHVVTRAAAALDRLANDDYALVLCDLMMPEMTGMELYERLAVERPEIAANMIFMTGGAFSPGGRAFLDQVSNARIDKPFDTEALRALVAARLAGPVDPRPPRPTIPPGPGGDVEPHPPRPPKPPGPAGG